MELIKKNLEILMRSSKMSQSELIRASGVSKGSVIHILSGNANTTIETLKKISDALGVELYELFLSEEIQLKKGQDTPDLEKHDSKWMNRKDHERMIGYLEQINLQLKEEIARLKEASEGKKMAV